MEKAPAKEPTHKPFFERADEKEPRKKAQGKRPREGEHARRPDEDEHYGEKSTERRVLKKPLRECIRKKNPARK